MRGARQALSSTRRSHWLPLAGLLVAPALVLLVLNALTPAGALFPNESDVLVYLHRAQDLASGGLPYRDFEFEYPPLALVSMAAPYVVWPAPGLDLNGYRWLFAAWESLLLTGLAVVTALTAWVLTAGRLEAERWQAVRTAAGRLLLVGIVMAPSLAWRYDLLPALLAGIALLLAISGWPAWAGALLGLSILAKVYPLFLIPAFGVLWLAPVRWRRLALFSAGIGMTVAAVILPLWLVAGDQTWSFVSYQTDRGLQLESLPAGAVLLLNLGSEAGVPLSFDFGSVQVSGAAAADYLAIQMWVTFIGFVALATLGVVLARRERVRVGTTRMRTVVSLAAACVLLLLVTGRVFSVQYVVWLLPMAVLLPRGQFSLVVLIGALSVAVHPLFYEQLIDQEVAAVLLLNIRNGLVLLLFAWVIVGLVRRSLVSPGQPVGFPRSAQGATEIT